MLLSVQELRQLFMIYVSEQSHRNSIAERTPALLQLTCIPLSLHFMFKSVH